MVLDAILTVALVVVLFGAALALGRAALLRIRWTAPIKWVEASPPAHWAGIITDRFPLARTLTDDAFHRLLRLVQVFRRDKRFEGAGRFEITEEVELTIAAQACYLILGFEGACYPQTKTVLIYPSTFVPKRPMGTDSSTGVHHDPPPLVGEAWGHGTVVLAWDNVLRGAVDPRDGKNLVFHEFAHQLDQEDGEAGGTPAGMPNLKVWGRVLERRFTQLQRKARKGQRSVLDHYGATNRTEFFAVATEAFFERPYSLRKAEPDLYASLADFYGRDPAEERSASARRERGSE